jgi:hypothetical protein
MKSALAWPQTKIKKNYLLRMQPSRAILTCMIPASPGANVINIYGSKSKA